jgi:hypothetical protein
MSPLVLALLAPDVALAVDGGEYQCRSGNLTRRIVIEVGDPQTGLPCEVVYWKDQEAPGERRVLWNARTDRSYCETKALGLTKTLSDGGWNCTVSQESATAPAAAPAPPPALAAPAPARQPAPQLPLAARTPEPSPPPAPQPPALAAPQPAPAPPATTAALPAPTPEPAAGPPAADLAPSGAARADLDLVIEHNLQSLNQSVDGDFEAQIAKFGDLNRDGLEDAVVFFNYHSSGAELTQFVAAYLFNGKTYHLAATKPISGSDRGIRAVEVEDIVDGSILMRLHLDGGGEASRRAAMVLQDGQLVEAN